MKLADVSVAHPFALMQLDTRSSLRHELDTSSL